MTYFLNKGFVNVLKLTNNFVGISILVFSSMFLFYSPLELFYDNYTLCFIIFSFVNNKNLNGSNEENDKSAESNDSQKSYYNGKYNNYSEEDFYILLDSNYLKNNRCSEEEIYELLNNELFKKVSSKRMEKRLKERWNQINDSLKNSPKQ